MTPLEELYAAYPDKDFDEEMLLYNPQISFNFAKQYPKLSEILWVYAKNPNLDLSFLENFPDCELSSEEIDKLVKNITFEQACSDPVKYKIFFENTDNPNITVEMVKNNPQYPWEEYFLIKNPNTTWDDVIKYDFMCKSEFNPSLEVVLNNPDIDFDLSKLSSRENSTLDDILNNINLSWDWLVISRRDDITIEFVKKCMEQIKYYSQFIMFSKCISVKDVENNPDLPWEWSDISYMHDFDINFILRNLDKKFDWCQISMSEKIKMEDIKNNPQLSWNYCCVSDNPNITIEFILENLNNDLDFFKISMNYAITMEIIKNYPDLPWDYRGLSNNSNLSARFIMDNIDKDWDFGDISAIELKP